MVQQSQFGGNAIEDPNAHLATFLEICDTIKMNGVNDDTIRLRLFPFSLKDKAKIWLHSHVPNTFTTLNDLSRVFLNKYFPPGKTVKFRMDIISLVNLMVNRCMKFGNSLESCFEDVHIMDFPIGLLYKTSITVYLSLLKY